jgi:hypothetical protein
MRKIEKKSWPKLFREMGKNKNHFEVRLADFKIKEGDYMILKEWNPKTKRYTGKKLKFSVGSTLKLPKDMEKFYSRKDIKKYGFFIIELKK